MKFTGNRAEMTLVEIDNHTSSSCLFHDRHGDRCMWDDGTCACKCHDEETLPEGKEP